MSVLTESNGTTATGTAALAAAPAPADDAALAKVTQWANDYLARLTERTSERLAGTLLSKGASASADGRFRPDIGEPTVGTYVAFDVAATSPIQPIALPPYDPGKVIAAGEPAFLVAFLFVNPVVSVPNGFAVPPAVQLGGRGWRVTLDLANITTGAHSTEVIAGTYGPVAVGPTFVIFSLPTPDPGPDPDVYEANVTLDITTPAQPYAAFATNFLDLDVDPGFLFVPPAGAGWRHEIPNRYMVYRK